MVLQHIVIDFLFYGRWPNMVQTGWHIRKFCLEDLDKIVQIEKSALSAWSRRAIEAELQNSSSQQTVICDLKQGKIIGWCCYRIIPPEVELLKITVAQTARRKGFGTLLITDMMEKCLAQNCPTLYLEVRMQNSGALQFYKKLGFTQQAIRKNYYKDPLDHGVILQGDLRSFLPPS